MLQQAHTGIILLVLSMIKMSSSYSLERILYLNICPEANLCTEVLFTNFCQFTSGSRQAVNNTCYCCHGYMVIASSCFIACPLGRLQYELHCTAPPLPIPPPTHPHTHTLPHTHHTSAYPMQKQNQTQWPKLTEHT